MHDSEIQHEDPESARGHERLLCKVVEMKSGLPLRSQDIRNARPMGYLPTGAPHREWNCPKRVNYLVGSEAVRTEPSKPFNM